MLRRVRRQKYRCHQGCTPVTAPAPPRLIPGGRYSLEFAVHVALMKYGFHLPLARQQRLSLREGLGVEAQKLWEQLDALAGHLRKSYEALLAEVFTSPVIHADETYWLLLEKGPGTQFLGQPRGAHRQQPRRAADARQGDGQEESLRQQVEARHRGRRALFYSLIERARLRGEEPGHYLRRAALAAIENPDAVTLPESQD